MSASEDQIKVLTFDDPTPVRITHGGIEEYLTITMKRPQLYFGEAQVMEAQYDLLIDIWDDFKSLFYCGGNHKHWYFMNKYQDSQLHRVHKGDIQKVVEDYQEFLEHRKQYHYSGECECFKIKTP